jgi:hypothetical protein
MINATSILHFALRDIATNSPYLNKENGASDEWIEAVIELAKLFLGKPVHVQALCNLPCSARSMLFAELAANPVGHRFKIAFDPYESHLVPELTQIAEGKPTEIKMSYQWGGFSGTLRFPGRR